MLLPTVRSVLNALVTAGLSSGSQVLAWLGKDFTSALVNRHLLKTQQCYTIFLEGNKGKFGKDLLEFINLGDIVP